MQCYLPRPFVRRPYLPLNLAQASAKPASMPVATALFQAFLLNVPARISYRSQAGKYSQRTITVEALRQSKRSGELYVQARERFGRGGQGSWHGWQGGSGVGRPRRFLINNVISVIIQTNVSQPWT